MNRWLVGAGVIGALSALALLVGGRKPRIIPLGLTGQPRKAPLYETHPASYQDASVRLAFLRWARPDATAWNDKYTRHSFTVYQDERGRWYTSEELDRIPFKQRPSVTPLGGWSVDEYGRQFKGKPGWIGSVSPEQALRLVVTAAGYTLPHIPGLGSAANAALQAAIALGQGKSAQDVALAAARGAMPPEVQVGFDIAAGIAAGQSVEDAALEATFARYPDARVGYNAFGKLGGQ